MTESRCPTCGGEDRPVPDPSLRCEDAWHYRTTISSDGVIIERGRSIELTCDRPGCNHGENGGPETAEFQGTFRYNDAIVAGWDIELSNLPNHPRFAHCPKCRTH